MSVLSTTYKEDIKILQSLQKKQKELVPENEQQRFRNSRCQHPCEESKRKLVKPCHNFHIHEIQEQLIAVDHFFQICSSADEKVREDIEKTLKDIEHQVLYTIESELKHVLPLEKINLLKSSMPPPPEESLKRPCHKKSILDHLEKECISEDHREFVEKLLSKYSTELNHENKIEQNNECYSHSIGLLSKTKNLRPRTTRTLASQTCPSINTNNKETQTENDNDDCDHVKDGTSSNQIIPGSIENENGASRDEAINNILLELVNLDNKIREEISWSE